MVAIANNRVFTPRDILRTLEKRRRELDMPMSVLARHARVGLRTIQRLLSGEAEDANLGTVAAIAYVLGVGLCPKPVAAPRIMRSDAAKRKAKRLAAMVQGTSALEAQAVDRNVMKDIEDRITHELLASSSSQLWDD